MEHPSALNLTVLWGSPPVQKKCPKTAQIPPPPKKKNHKKFKKPERLLQSFKQHLLYTPQLPHSLSWNSPRLIFELNPFMQWRRGRRVIIGLRKGGGYFRIQIFMSNDKVDKWATIISPNTDMGNIGSLIAQYLSYWAKSKPTLHYHSTQPWIDLNT